MNFDRALGPCLFLTVWAASCGDDSRGDASASASSTATVTATTGGSTTSASDTATQGTGGATSGVTEGGVSVSGATEATSAANTATDTTAGTTGADAKCAEEQPPAYQGPFDGACAAEPQAGTFNPVVEWTKKDFTLSPGSVNSLATPIVVSLDDDDGNGKLDAADMPDVVRLS